MSAPATRASPTGTGRPVQAGYIHPTDSNIVTAAAVLASWVAATI